MEEDHDDGQWTDIAHGKVINGEEELVETVVVGKLLIHRFTGDIPTHEETR